MSTDVGKSVKRLRRLTPEEVARRKEQDPLLLHRKHAADAAEAGGSGGADVVHQQPVSATRDDRTPPKRGVAPSIEQTSAPKVAGLGRHGVVADKSGRRAALLSITPEEPAERVAVVRDTVIDLILNVPFVSYESDRGLQAVGVRFALWCLDNSADGQFVPERDLVESNLASFLNFARRTIRDSTMGTYASAVRRLGRMGHARFQGTRTVAQAPYSPRTKNAMWEAACAMTDQVGLDLRSLLALTFGAGCRSDEVHAMRASQVDTVNGTVVVSVVRAGGVVRWVPVYEEFAQWLSRRAGELEPEGYLFRPGCGVRRNATSWLVEKMGARVAVFKGFRSTRARHTWLCDLLAAGIPFHVVCHSAGLVKDSHLPADMLPYLPTVLSTRGVVATFNNARSQQAGAAS